MKKECAFIDIPDEAQPAFIGKSGDHITSLRDEYNVTIEILPEGRLQVQGSESNVQSAKAAIGDWMKAWEGQHIGKSFDIEGSDIPAIIGSKGSVVNSIQKDFGVMIDIDRDAGMVTIRGGKVTEDRDAAEEKVKDVIRQHHADVAKKEEERKAAAAAAARAEKQRREKAAAGSSDGTGASNTKTNGKSLASDTGDSRKSRSNEYLAVPVGMTVTASKKSASKKKDRVSLELCAHLHTHVGFSLQVPLFLLTWDIQLILIAILINLLVSTSTLY